MQFNREVHVLSVERERWLDIAKGIAIIAVVFGHSGEKLFSHYLFWFHMPLFFLVSGYLFKSVKGDIKSWSFNKSKKLLIPYFSFGILILLISFILITPNVMNSVKQAAGLVYGGRALKGIFGPFWFITCLLLTQIIFAIIQTKLKSTKVKVVFIASLYVLAHAITYFLSKKDGIQIPVPWAIDISLVALTYYSMGYYLKDIIRKCVSSVYIGFSFLIVSAVFVTLDYKGFIYYKLDMKYSIYNNFLLDLIIPLALVISILFISYHLEKLSLPLLSYLGTRSLSIMYLHIVVNAVAKQYLTYNFIVFTAIGIIIPITIDYLLQKTNLTNYLFFGISPKKKCNTLNAEYKAS